MENKKQSIQSQSRRKFIKGLGLAGAAFTIVPRSVLGGNGFVATSDTLYITGIGAGGKGKSDLSGFAESKNVKVAFLCDVDDRQVAKSQENFPDAKYYKDYRIMLEKEKGNIDAV